MRKYFVISAFTTLYLLFSSMSCEKDGHRYILLINNSDSVIYFKEFRGQIINPVDTFFRCYTAGLFGKINPKDTIYSESSNLIWEQDLGKGGIPFVEYFVFKSDYPIKHCHEDSIKELTERYQLKRYQLTKEDLDRMNWTITYP